jgi:hypothetical protein
MKGKVNRAEARQSEGGLIFLYHFNIAMATAQFHFDTPPLWGELHFAIKSLYAKTPDRRTWARSKILA